MHGQGLDHGASLEVPSDSSWAARVHHRRPCIVLNAGQREREGTMTLTREDPGPLRTRVASARVATGFAALLSVVTAAAVYRYGADVLDYAREQGLESSAIETWSRPAALLLIALPAGWTVASAVGLRRVLGRFRIADDFERRLR